MGSALETEALELGFGVFVWLSLLFELCYLQFACFDYVSEVLEIYGGYRRSSLYPLFV